MKKLILLLIMLLIPITANALEISKEGFSGVGENEVQVDLEKLNLDYAVANNIFTFTSSEDFSLIQSKAYTKGQLDDGTFDNDRNDLKNVTYALNTKAPHYYVVYNKPLTTTGPHNISGYFEMIFKKVARLQDGTECDIKIKIDNVLIDNKRPTTRYYGLYQNSPAFISRAALQERPASGIFDRSDDYSGLEFSYDIIDFMDIGASYDVTVNVINSQTSEKVNKKMVFKMEDLDVHDQTIGGKYEQDGNIPDYVESVTLISGFDETIYLRSDTVLNISNNNTRYAATQITDSEDRSAEQKSAFMTRVNAGEYKFRWAGSACGTGIGFINPFKVVTSTSGTYKDNVKITETDNEVLWKETKEIKITPDEGYFVSQITIDGIKIDYQSLKKENGKRIYSTTVNGKNITYEFIEDEKGNVTYTFNKVIENHAIDVSVDKKDLKVIVPDTLKKALAVGIGVLLMILAGVVYYLNKKTNKV